MRGANSFMRGVVNFTIVDHGTMGEDGDFEPLIVRAANVACILTGRIFVGDMNDYLELVSVDKQKKEVTFRLKQ